MKNKNKLILCLCLLFTFQMVSCIGTKKGEDSNVKIFYNKNTIKSIEEMKVLVDEYKNKEKKEIELVGVDSEEEIKKLVGAEKDSAIVLLDGYAFIDFISNDYLRNLTYLYKEKNTREKFSLITNLYGRYNGKYFGVGFMPFSLELVYNRDMLKKLGIEVKDNNMIELMDKLVKKGVKIPSYISDEYSKELLLSALVANDTIIYDMGSGEITSKLPEKIKEIKNGQSVMDKINKYYQEGILREENFVDMGEEGIEDFNNNKIPVILTTTLAAKKLTTKVGNYTVNKLPIKNDVNAPVGIDIIITSTVGDKKMDEVDSFLRFLLQSDVFDKLGEKNIVTGNKDADSKLNGIQGEEAASIHASDSINKLYINVISNEDILKIENEVKNIMKGKYDGQEWERVVK